jgi:hypothetical protein
MVFPSWARPPSGRALFLFGGFRLVGVANRCRQDRCVTFCKFCGYAVPGPATMRDWPSAARACVRPAVYWPCETAEKAERCGQRHTARMESTGLES